MLDVESTVYQLGNQLFPAFEYGLQDVFHFQIQEWDVYLRKKLYTLELNVHENNNSIINKPRVNFLVSCWAKHLRKVLDGIPKFRAIWFTPIAFFSSHPWLQ